MKLDIQTSIQTAFIIALLLALLSFVIGVRTIRAGNRLQYFRKRRDLIVQGWRMIFVAFGFGIASFLVNGYAAPLAYKAFPPSPTITNTPTITVTPTISLTPTISETPTITNTPSVTNTPALPPEVLSKFESTTTPRAVPIFSPVRFARKIDKNYQPVDPANEFANPINEMFGVFSYDKMTPGAEWSALWYRNGELVYFETIPWNGGTGGYGYTQWAPPTEEWQPGTYEVQIFVGTEWVKGSSGTFTVTGNPPTSTPTKPPTRTLSPTPTIGPSPTRTDTVTPLPTVTPTVSRTPRPTDTRWATLTPGA